MQLYEDIYNLLIKNVDKEDILQELGKLYNYIENKYFKYFEFDYSTIYLLKDTLWFNIEHTGDRIGLTNLKDVGSKFKIINQFENNLILNKEDIEKLKEEINYLIDNWNNDWIMAEIYSDNDTNVWNKHSNVIIHNENESPRKYNYFKRTSIINDENKHLFMNKDVVLCKLNGKIGDNFINNILYDNILKLKELCKTCLEENKYLILKGV
jgi:hypothetical protein